MGKEKKAWCLKDSVDSEVVGKGEDGTIKRIINTFWRSLIIVGEDKDYWDIKGMTKRPNVLSIEIGKVNRNFRRR